MHRFTALLSAAIAAFILTFASANVARAQEGPIPTLVAGRHVYAMPADYVRPDMSPNSIQQLEEALQGRHHPFYVVFVQQVSASDPSAATVTLTDTIIRTWQHEHPELYTNESNVFMMVETPRLTSLNAGMRWVAPLQLNAQGVRRFRELLGPYMRGTTPDPVGGILAVALGLDEFIFDQTDPDRIQAREEAAARVRQQYRQRRMEQAHHEAAQALIDELYRAVRIQSLPREYLPLHREAHDLALAEARQVQTEGGATTDAIDVAKSRLQRENNELERYMRGVQSTETMATIAGIIIGLVILAILGAIIAMLVSQYNKKSKLTSDFQVELGMRQDRLNLAFSDYTDFDKERDTIKSAMEKASGQTSALYISSTTMIDGILNYLEAMEAHLNHCTEQASKAWLFNLDHLRAAIAAFEEPFTFDTGNVKRKKQLFRPSTKQITIDPSPIESDPDRAAKIAGPKTKIEKILADMFETGQEGWERLQAALAVRGTANPKEDLREALFIELKQRASENKIPASWLASHPLASGAEAVHRELDALLASDPVAYVARLEQLRTRARTVTKHVDEAIAIVKPIFGTSTNATVPSDTVVDDVDSPLPHVEAAMREEGALSALLIAGAHFDELQLKVDLIKSERDQAERKAEQIRFCLEKADEALEAAKTSQTTANTAKSELDTRLLEVHKAHADVDASFLVAVETRLETATATLASANRALTKRKHVTARRLALTASEEFKSVMQAIEAAYTHYTFLDSCIDATAREVAEALSLHNELGAKHEAIRERVRAARSVHASTQVADRHLDIAKAALGDAKARTKNAQDLASKKKYQRAQATADEALDLCRKASTNLEDAVRWCQEQDRLKAELEELEREDDRFRTTMISRLAAVNGRKKLNAVIYRNSSGSAVMDFAVAVAEAKRARAEIIEMVEAAESDDAERRARIAAAERAVVAAAAAKLLQEQEQARAEADAAAEAKREAASHDNQSNTSTGGYGGGDDKSNTDVGNYGGGGDNKSNTDVGDY